MGETFRLSGSIAPGSYVAITPPAGKLYIIGQGTLILTGTLRFGYRPKMADPSYTIISEGSSGFCKPFFPVTSGAALTGPAYPVLRYYHPPYSPELGNLNGLEELCIINDGGSSGTYCITGPVSTLANEGIESARTFGIWGSTASISWTTETVMPAGYCYLVNQVMAGYNTTIQLLDSDDSHIMYLTPNGQRFWLWSEMQLKFRVNVANTDYGGGLRVTRYAETANLEEYVNRISMKQVLAGGAYVDIIPAANETIYIDLHNAYSIGLQVLWNGVTQETNGTPLRFQLSSTNWLRFKNPSGSSMLLFLTGTKIAD